MAVTGPNTGFVIVNADGGTSNIDLGKRYVSKDYYLDAYPNLASATGSRNSPGLWSWGFNTSGQLGLNDLTHRSSPVQIGTLTNWKQISSGAKQAGTSVALIAAIKTDGTLWAWGSNGFAQLGLNDITHRSSPTQVGSLTNWKQVVCGNYHTASIKTDGTLWTWGYNVNGQLGRNNITSYSSPVQVGTSTNWKLVACGSYHTLAIKTDGTLWSWGRNNNGQLGFNDITHRSSPTQVGSLTDWKQVAAGANHAAAVKTDGTLWTWGGNISYGSLGLNDMVHRSSPTQVGSLTDWKLVSLGEYVSYSIKTDGTLWASGRHNAGGTDNTSSFIQIGSLTNWKSIYIGNRIPAAIKTDGTLWSWGFNTNGQLGQNDIANRFSPIQIGTYNSWKSAGSGYNSITAIKDGYY